MSPPAIDVRQDRKLLNNFLRGDTKITLEPVTKISKVTNVSNEEIPSQGKPKVKKPKGTPSEKIISYLKTV